VALWRGRGRGGGRTPAVSLLELSGRAERGATGSAAIPAVLGGGDRVGAGTLWDRPGVEQRGAAANQPLEGRRYDGSGGCQTLRRWLRSAAKGQLLPGAGAATGPPRKVAARLGYALAANAPPAFV